MKTFLTATALSLLAASGVAVAMQADPAGPAGPPKTKAEAIARADARFDRLDTNKDGQLSAEERKAGMEAARKAMAARRGGELGDFVPRGGGGMGERMMARVDTNGDGLISREENRAAAIARFERMDADKDGKIEAGERRGPGMGKRDGKPGDRMARRGPGGPGGRGPGMLMMADTNKDGVVTRAEFDAMSAAHFAQLDTNKDGKIDAAEMKAMHEKMRERMGKMREKMRERRGDMPPPPPAPSPNPGA
ncbi:hypothetical protein [Sphingomonas sp.]|uniref:hypothetical protein n=1 Tax=Sphingomonas sp. TaxID=28214 RepID=UPI001EC1E390|nr:hypothetical protein [Sphingomonas sp.]MBX3594194.1 hypothetical protein [Sphingomonas sp.]